MQTFLVLALSVIVGRLLDAQLHRAVVCTGGALTTLGFLALSFTGRQGHEGEGIYGLVLLTHGLVAGIGMSFFFTHSSHCVIQVRHYPIRFPGFHKADRSSSGFQRTSISRLESHLVGLLLVQ